jgi:predicted MPP superfamily phosphohydrolase
MWLDLVVGVDMKIIARYLVFFVMFLSLSLSMNYYIFSHLSFMLDMNRSIWFWVFIALSSLAWILSMLLYMTAYNRAVQAFHIAASLWLGVLFMFLFTLLGYDVLRHSVDIDTSNAGPIIIALVGAFITFGVLNARILRVREVDVPTEKLEGGLRVVHLTDIHFGALYGPMFLMKIVGRVRALKPDLVLITGDLADGPQRYTEQTFAALDLIEAPIYFSTGNHETYAGIDNVLGALAKTKVKVLRNEVEDNGTYQIVGVEDTWGRGAVKQVLEKVELDPSKYTILMFHRPQGLYDARDKGVDLMLTGHTHAGQFYPFNLMVRAIWRKVKGLYDLGGMHLYAGSGVGTWGPPIRVGTSSEIALIRVNGVHA